MLISPPLHHQGGDSIKENAYSTLPPVDLLKDDAYKSATTPPRRDLLKKIAYSPNPPVDLLKEDVYLITPPYLL